MAVKIRPVVFLFLLLILSACSAAPTPAPTLTQAAVFAASPTPPPTLPPTHTSTAAPVPPTLTPTAVPSPTPTPHPMSIAAMRQASYPGSDITIEKELAPGANYHRYYASYQSEGLKIYALLTVPNGDPPPGGWPAIVFNHGYIPPQVYRTTERYVAYVDALARSGYVVFRSDYRGHDQSEGTPEGAYGSPGYTVDVLNAVSSLRRYPSVNPQKIGMWGHSMGGFITLRAMVISPDIKVGVIWSGVVGSYNDLLYNWHRAEGATSPTPVPGARPWRNQWIKQYGTPAQNPAFWDSISANAFLRDLSGPLQLHVSLTDPEVPAQFSQTLAQQVKDAGGTVELYTYEDDDHNLSHSFSHAMARTIEFFDRYLK